MLVNEKGKPLVKRTLTCWGLNKSVQSYLFEPCNLEEIYECLNFAKIHNLSICPKGSGNSFGDVFLIQDHVSVDVTRFNKIKSFDPVKGILVCEPGVLLSQILSLVMPINWFLASVSGSIDTTLAGAVSSNIHGKDSWKYGNFSNNLVSFKLLLASGEILDVERERDNELFNAVSGGLGLLGMLVEITIQLRKIPSFMVICQSQRVRNFTETEKSLYGNPDQPFIYSWIDAFATGSSMGKGLTESARFIEARPEEYLIKKFREELLPKSKIMMLPPEVFWPVFRLGWNPLMLQVLNKLKYYFSFLSGNRTKAIPFSRYQYLWAALPKSNLASAPAGFMELQNLFRKDVAVKAFAELLGICRQFNRIPEVCGIKRFRQDSPYLSFSGDGMSISIDFMLNKFPQKDSEAFRQKLIETVLKYNGKTYLAKYPFFGSDVFEKMYPMHWKFKEIKNKYDPNRVYWSDAAERLLK